MISQTQSPRQNLSNTISWTGSLKHDFSDTFSWIWFVRHSFSDTIAQIWSLRYDLGDRHSQPWSLWPGFSDTGTHPNTMNIWHKTNSVTLHGNCSPYSTTILHSISRHIYVRHWIPYACPVYPGDYLDIRDTVEYILFHGNRVSIPQQGSLFFNMHKTLHTFAYKFIHFLRFHNVLIELVWVSGIGIGYIKSSFKDVVEIHFT